MTSFSQLLEKSYNLYRDNFTLFFQLSVAQALLGLITGQISKVIDDDFIVVSLLIGLILLYFQMRLAVALVYAVIDRHNNKSVNVLEKYHQSKEKIWQYIGATFLLMLMIIIPIAILIAIFVASDNLVIEVLVVLIGSGIGLFLLMHYILAPYIVILNPNSKTAFKESFNLVRPIRDLAALVALTSAFLVGAPYLLFEILDISGATSEIMGSLLQAVLAPLNLCIVLLFYINFADQSNQKPFPPSQGFTQSLGSPE